MYDTRAVAHDRYYDYYTYDCSLLSINFYILGFILLAVILIFGATIVSRQSSVHEHLSALHDNGVMERSSVQAHFSRTFHRMLYLRSAEPTAPEMFAWYCASVDVPPVVSTRAPVASLVVTEYFSFVPGHMFVYTTDQDKDVIVYTSGPWYVVNLGARLSYALSLASTVISAATSTTVASILPGCAVNTTAQREWGPIDYMYLDHLFSQEYRVSVVLWTETQLCYTFSEKIPIRRSSSRTTVLYKQSIETKRRSRKKWKQKRRFIAHPKIQKQCSPEPVSGNVRVKFMVLTWLLFSVFSEGGHPFIDVIRYRILLFLYICLWSALLVGVQICCTMLRTYWRFLLQIWGSLDWAYMDMLRFLLVLNQSMQYPDPLPDVRSSLLAVRYSFSRIFTFWSLWFLFASTEFSNAMCKCRRTSVLFIIFTILCNPSKCSLSDNLFVYELVYLLYWTAHSFVHVCRSLY